MTTQNCHSQYVKNVINHLRQNTKIIQDSILNILHALIPEDMLDSPILQLRPGTFPRDNGVIYSPRDFFNEISRLLTFNFRHRFIKRDLKIVQLCNSYVWFKHTFPSWYEYRSRKQSKGSIERYGMSVIKQLNYFKHLGKFIFRLIDFRHFIFEYMEMSELDQKINQSRMRNIEKTISSTVSDMNYFFNVINQEYQKHLSQLIPPINPSKSRSDMMKMESFFKDLGHLKQTSRGINELIETEYPVVQNVGSSLVKFIQSPQQSKGDHEMVHHLVTLLSIRIAK